MHHATVSAALATLLASNALARDIPSNVKALYDSIRGSGSCSNVLQGGFYSQEGDSKGSCFLSIPHDPHTFTNLNTDFCYCGDHLDDKGIIYLQGNGGQLVNMDIDCDGKLGSGNGDCDSSGDTQGQTTFGDTVVSYNKGVSDLNAYVHSYVVLGNQGTKDGYVEFDPQSVGVEPLSVVAVVCGDKMVSFGRNILGMYLYSSRLTKHSFTAFGATLTVTMVPHW